MRSIRRAVRRQHLESYILEAMQWGRIVKKRRAEEAQQATMRKRKRAS